MRVSPRLCVRRLTWRKHGTKPARRVAGVCGQRQHTVRVVLRPARSKLLPGEPAPWVLLQPSSRRVVRSGEGQLLTRGVPWPDCRGHVRAGARASAGVTLTWSVTERPCCCRGGNAVAHPPREGASCRRSLALAPAAWHARAARLAREVTTQVHQAMEAQLRLDHAPAAASASTDHPPKPTWSWRWSRNANN